MKFNLVPIILSLIIQLNLLDFTLATEKKSKENSCKTALQKADADSPQGISKLNPDGPISKKFIVDRVNEWDLSETPLTRHLFVKDVPTLIFLINENNYDKLPVAIAKHLKSKNTMDTTEYDVEDMRRYIGSGIALQIYDDNRADFYPVGIGAFKGKYLKIPLQDVKSKNKQVWNALEEHFPEVLALADTGLLVGALKTDPVAMIKTSDLGPEFATKNALTIESLRGEQSAIAGQDSWLVYNEDTNEFNMVNIDPASDQNLPTNYVPYKVSQKALKLMISSRLKADAKSPLTTYDFVKERELKSAKAKSVPMIFLRDLFPQNQKIILESSMGEHSPITGNDAWVKINQVLKEYTIVDSDGRTENNYPITYVPKVFSQQEIRESIDKLSQADSSEALARFRFNKQPILGLLITEDNYSSVPDAIAKNLAKKDGTKYSDEYIKKNIGSLFAIQIESDGTPDYYIISKEALAEDYQITTTKEIQEHNATLWQSIEERSPELLTEEFSQLLVGAQKVGTTEMYKISQVLDVPHHRSVSIEDPWGGEQTGRNAFVVLDPSSEDGEPQYYMVGLDEGTGFPSNYVPIDEGDITHRIWDQSNSYLTRFKPIKNAQGENVTSENFNQFIADNATSNQTQRQYRLLGGIYHENIKKLNNQNLAPNNQKENSLGGRDFVDNLQALLLTSFTSAEANSSEQMSRVELIEQKLANIHTAWWERNKSWTEPYNIAKDFTKFGAENQYTAAYQFYQFAKSYGALENLNWKKAFDTVMTTYAQKRFKPLVEKTASDSTLHIVRGTGSLPPVWSDTFLKSFLEEKLAKIDNPTNLASEKELALWLFKNHIQTTLTGFAVYSSENLRIAEPLTKPGSGARIFIFQEEIKKPLGRSSFNTIGVLKIETAGSGFSELLSLIMSESVINEQIEYNEANHIEMPTTVKPAKVLLSGRLSQDRFFTFQQAADGREVKSLLTVHESFFLRLTESVAEALSKIHGPYVMGLNETPQGFEADFTTFQGAAYFDLQKLENFEISKETVISSTTANSVSKIINKAILDYAKVAETTPYLLSPTFVHGDFHAGNIFINNPLGGLLSSDSEANLIDYGTLAWTVGKKMGTGDRGNDVGRFIGSVLAERARLEIQLSDNATSLKRVRYRQTTFKAIDSFLQTYKESVGLIEGSAEEKAFDISVNFYLASFMQIILKDKTGKVFTPYVDETLEDLHQRVATAWYMYQSFKD